MDAAAAKLIAIEAGARAGCCDTKRDMLIPECIDGDKFII